MELSPRPAGDMLLPPGELSNIRRRLRGIAAGHDLASVIICAFDHRTRMLPFIFADTRMAPAGVRAIGSALLESGFEKTRIVLQQWNRHVRPSRLRLDGRVPDLLLLSSMQLHEDACREMIRDACRIDPAARPLIVTGGAKCLYQPFDFFSADPADPASCDVAVTGEEYVLLNLLEVLLSVRADGEPLRSAFFRARDDGALDDVPGLVFARDENDVGAGLIDTGIQRLAGDLDEQPHPVAGYSILEPPGRGTGLGPAPLAAGQVRNYSPLNCLVMTLGCKFNCPYCPIPAYNQKQFRAKSGARIADEMGRIHAEYGIRYYFGADDNFLNDTDRALDIIGTLARAEYEGTPLRKHVRWYTEVTVHDTIRMKEHLGLMRYAGCRSLWIGVEDMTATLVNKGQGKDKTVEAFRLLREAGICPMPMMMHHDSQPLVSRGSNYGLLNQVRLLQKAGAVSLQALMITPSAGSKLFEQTYTSGQVYDRVGGRPVEPRMYDGNYVIASRHHQPWKKQLNLMAAYLYFYNPIRLLVALVKRKSKLGLKPAGMQVIGMLGFVHTVYRTLGWAFRLAFGTIVRRSAPPVSTIAMRGIDGGTAAHAMPGTPPAEEAGD